MKILISGVCGFVGSVIARELLEREPGVEIFGFDNFIRPGSELNREPLQALGVKVQHADARSASDLETLPEVDWIIDAAANASVLAGVDGRTSSRQLVEHNLFGTVNLLELAKKSRAGLILLSTSRVYSIGPLASLAVEEKDGAYQPVGSNWSPGLSREGIAEEFSTAAPISIYGATKLASEVLALEYSAAFGFPVWINRCGVLAGAGQFGRADQGIFTYWINAYLGGTPLEYIGFDGRGFQARDCFHPRDLVPLLVRQMQGDRAAAKPQIVNLGGGRGNTMSLAQLSGWCAARFGKREIATHAKPRPFDLPWVVMDSSLAKRTWDWQPAIKLSAILDEIAAHAEAHPDWLKISAQL